jgi:hypothetical protein
MTHTFADNRLEAAARAAGVSAAYTPGRRYMPRRASYYDPADRPPKVPDPLPPTWAPGENAKLLLDLESGDCRFPVGDETGVLQLFCGNEAHAQADPPYCPECARRILPKGATVNPKVLH